MTKSYLSRQIKLITLKTSDLFTDSELEKHVRLITLKNEKAKLQKEKNPDQLSIQLLSEEIKKAYMEFKEELKANINLTRTVNTRCVCDYSYFTEKNGVKAPPDAISWDNLKLSRKICEFESELSRAMGIGEDEVTFDKIIIQWKSLEMLHGICVNGFTMPIYCNDGESIEIRKFKFFTASAGQLRTDKIQCISERMQKKIAPIVECGMTELKINAKGGINANKYMAYRALASSATDCWDFDIRKAIVIPDFEAPVTGIMDYITEQYTVERGIRTVMINHTDGCGVARPGVMPARNCMVRGPWLKGLMSEFDFIAFCKEKNIPAVIEDVWHKQHDLIAEDIQLMFTESQLKLAGYYESWDEYTKYFIDCGCHLGLTNYEENYITNSPLNYQMLQTLTELTDNDIAAITEKELQYLKDLGKDTNKMLEALRADANSNNAYRIMLRMYPELLRDALAKDSLKLTRKKRQMDAKSGQLVLNNKRLFAIPDLYAACEFWFEHKPEPKGLLEDGYIYSRVLKAAEEIDVLRSPHLYMEHAIRKVDTSDEVRKWFKTNGVYTSCHDLISRILQFDKQHCRFTE